MRQETMMVVFNEASASAKQAGVIHLTFFRNFQSINRPNNGRDVVYNVSTIGCKNEVFKSDFVLHPQLSPTCLNLLNGKHCLKLQPS